MHTDQLELGMLTLPILMEFELIPHWLYPAHVISFLNIISLLLSI